MDKTLLKSYRNLKQDHIRDYQNYFDQLELTLGDHKNENMMSIPERLQKMKEGQIDLDLIETYFHFGRYLLISSSREGSLAANLQGIWNGEFEPFTLTTHATSKNNVATRSKNCQRDVWL